MWRRLKEYFSFLKHNPDSKMLNMIANLSKIDIDLDKEEIN